jgi:hypothetical protein
MRDELAFRRFVRALIKFIYAKTRDQREQAAIDVTRARELLRRFTAAQLAKDRPR